MKISNKGTSSEMLERFQEKLDDLLKVPIETSTDILAGVSINDEESDSYFIELAQALDKAIDEKQIFNAWNISIEADGIDVTIVNKDATIDSYLIQYDEDITYDIDKDVENILTNLESMVSD